MMAVFPSTKMAVLRSTTKMQKHLRTLIFTMSHAFSSGPTSETSTVDSGEAAHFKSISPTWWDSSESRPLQSMNQLRVPFIRDGLVNTGIVKHEYVNSPEPLKNLHILDVGCGGGILSESLARLGAITTGMDAVPELIEVAKQHATLDPRLTNLTYEFSTIEQHATNNIEKYDAVVSSEVIEHVVEKRAFIESCVKCLKPGGSIFITTLNKTNAAWFVAIVLAEYVARALAKGTHDWEKFIEPHQLQRLLEDCNCRTTVVHGMWYNYFTNTWSWSSDNSVSYALQAVKS